MAKTVKKRIVHEVKSKEPEYMVQINDNKMLHKDILESLREVIIFMQGYEKFMKIQEDKVVTIAQLKSDIKDLQNLVDHKLRRLLPKGKLPAIEPRLKKEERVEVKVPERKEVRAPIMPMQPAPVQEEVATAASDLDALEEQLRDIENQLKNMN